MEEGLRYKIQHSGDLFVSAICGVVEAAKDSAKGIVLTYNINELKRKKRNLIKKAGERLALLKKENMDRRISDDDRLRKLLAEMQKLQNRIDAYVKERGV